VGAADAGWIADVSAGVEGAKGTAGCAGAGEGRWVGEWCRWPEESGDHASSVVLFTLA
jgi:hypothetical protein